jgi:hypothetical protein
MMRRCRHFNTLAVLVILDPRSLGAFVFLAVDDVPGTLV